MSETVAPDTALRALEAAAGAIAIADAGRPGLPLVHVNPALGALTGHAPAGLLGRPVADLVAAGADRRARADLEAALRVGAPWSGVVPAGRADGSTFLAEVAFTPLFGADGTRTHVVAVLRDVSREHELADELAATRTRYGRVIDDLAAAELRYRELVERIPAVVYVCEYAEGYPLRYVSPQVEDLLGHPPEAFVEQPELWDELVHPDDRERVKRAETDAYANQTGDQLVYRMIAKDGRTLWVSDRDEIVRDDGGRPLFVQGVVMDITAQRRAEEDVREERDRARRYLDLAGMVVLVLDRDGRVSLLNRAGHQMLGYPDGALLGCDWFETCVPAEERARRRARFAERFAGREDPPDGVEVPVLTAYGEIRLMRFHHTLVRDDAGRVTATMSSGIDVTERRRAEEQIAHLAYHDPLTGLPNRALLREHLHLALARARRNGTAVALLYLDLDDFKLVNDSLGHAAGDELLCRVAAELKRRTRASDLLVRQGGDEFLVLLSDLPREDAESAARAAAVSLRGALTDPFRIAGAEFHVGTSIGISLYPRDAEDAEALLKHADAAMYQAKSGGPSEIVIYAENPSRPIERLSLSTRLRRAITEHELVLHWQPIVALDDLRIVGVEALVRWRDPDRGVLLPDEFVPFAEETGLIGRLGSWVAEAVCEQRLAWREAGWEPDVHLNVSPRQMAQRGFVADLVGRLGYGGMDLSGVTVEITESLALHDDGRAVPLLRELHETGLRLAIDDFGAGWSSLGRLRDLPVQVVKIDRSFLAGVPDSREGSAIVRAMLQLIDALAMEAVAEGVETDAQREFLAETGCPRGQGYLLGRPLPVDELDPLIDGALTRT
ncbi:MAG: EAL domain-containing protein [Solirubrobacteraceae bacterium]|nr:EAL domain-containing protein [Solirubrobacteraceae bacterium]